VFAADWRPLTAGVRLQVQRSELVDADHHHRIAWTWFDLAVGDVVQLEDAVLLDFEVWVVGLLPRLHRLKRHALLTEQDPQALMADVVDHPLSDEMLGQLGQRPRRERPAVILRSGQRDLLDPAPLRQRERRRPATGIARIQRVEPVSVEVVDHRPDPVLGGERQRGDLADVHPLRRPQHDLRPAPRHDRTRTPAHRPQQPVAFVVADLSHPDTFSHPRMKTGLTTQVVDAPPPTLPVAALAWSTARRRLM
jgi:hypothetical protein